MAYQTLPKEARYWSDTEIIPDPSLTFEYRVYAFAGTKTSAQPAASVIADFAAPTNLQTEKLSDKSYKLTWSDNSTGEQGFKIDRKIDQGNWATAFGTVAANQTSFTDTNVFRATSLEYRVYGFYESYTSIPINTNTNAELTAPTNLQIIQNSITSVTLTWNDNSTGEDGFKIERKYEGESWEQLSNTTDPFYEDNDFELNTQVYYQVFAYLDMHNSTMTSNTFFSFTPAPEITITPDDDTLFVIAGNVVSYQFDINSQIDLLTASVKLIIESSEYIFLDTTFIAGNKNVSKVVDVIIPESTADGIIAKVTFSATTEYKTTMVDRHIEIIKCINEFTNIELKAQADGPISADANLSFYSASTNERFTYNQADTDEASAIIDLVFTHHSIFKNGDTNYEMSFQSPNEQNLVNMWNNFPSIPFPYDATNKNLTYIKLLEVFTNTDWNNLDVEGIDAAIGDIGTLSILRGLNNDDFIGFQTVDGKKGIIKVTATNPVTNPYSEATVTFDLKVQCGNQFNFEKSGR